MAKTFFNTRCFLVATALLCSVSLGSKQIEIGLRQEDYVYANRQFADHEIPAAIDVAVREARRFIGLVEEKGNRGRMVDAFNRLAGAPVGSPWCASVQYFIDATSIICRETVRSAFVPKWGNSKSPLITVWDRRWRNKGMEPYVKCGCKFTIYFASMKRDAHIGMIDQVSQDSIEMYTSEGNTSEVPGATGQADREGRVYTRKKRRVDSISKVLCPIEFLTYQERRRFIYNKKR